MPLGSHPDVRNGLGLHYNCGKFEAGFYEEKENREELEGMSGRSVMPNGGIFFQYVNKLSIYALFDDEPYLPMNSKRSNFSSDLSFVVKLFFCFQIVHISPIQQN
jgi:hypothetical protein